MLRQRYGGEVPVEDSAAPIRDRSGPSSAPCWSFTTSRNSGLLQARWRTWRITTR